MAKKVYAVRKGRKTGLFKTWSECKANVSGYPGAEYKGFLSKKDAEAFMNNEQEEIVLSSIDNNKTAIAYVDGSFDLSAMRYAYGAVIIYRGEEIELSGAYDDKENAELRNVAGEIMSSEKAVNYCIENNIEEVIIYHDYAGIAKWGNSEWKTNLPMTAGYKKFINDSRKKISIKFVKVKGHSGDKYNDMADKLAKKALGIS